MKRENNAKVMIILALSFLILSCNSDTNSVINGISQKADFIDDFKSGDLSLTDWKIQNYSFPGNGCEMANSQIKLEKSNLVLTLKLNENNIYKRYKGGEIGSIDSFKYGYFSVRLKNDIIPGTISSFFLMNKWQANNWEHKEIDIEFLGKNTKEVQFTVHHYKDGGKKHTYFDFVCQLGFDSSDDYHEYGILWHKDSVSWFVDGKFAHSENRILIDENMFIRLNHWATEPNDTTGLLKWMCPLDTIRLPSRVYYDFVKCFPVVKQ